MMVCQILPNMLREFCQELYLAILTGFKDLCGTWEVFPCSTATWKGLASCPLNDQVMAAQSQAFAYMNGILWDVDVVVAMIPMVQFDSLSTKNSVLCSASIFYIGYSNFLISQPLVFLICFQLIRLNNERFSIPELLFYPSDVGIQEMGITEAIVHSINKCPEETRPHLYRYQY